MACELIGGTAALTFIVEEVGERHLLSLLFGCCMLEGTWATRGEANGRREDVWGLKGVESKEI